MAARSQTNDEELMNHLHGRLVGQAIAGNYVLARHIRSEADGDWFLANAGEQTVEVLLAPRTAQGADARLAAWREIAALSHPNLIKIVEAGSANLAGADYLYAVVERADENLAEILPERKLGAEEGVAIVAALANCLAFLHGRGWEHGEVNPGNVFAVGDTIKLSSTAVRVSRPTLAKPGQNSSGGSDVRQLGELIKQSVGEPGQPLPGRLGEIVEHCLAENAEQQWSAEEIFEFVGRGTRPGLPAASAEPTNAGVAVESLQAEPHIEPRSPGRRKPLVLGVVIAILLAIAIAVTPHIVPKQAAPQPKAEAPVAAAPVSQPAPTESPRAPEAVPAPESGTSAAPGQEVIKRVMPDVSSAALRTITGKVSVRVDLRVNQSGNVERASLGGAGTSHYFADKALAAARQWKFTADNADGIRAYALHFTFRRSGIDTAVERM
jgi:TonB family protein